MAVIHYFKCSLGSKNKNLLEKEAFKEKAHLIQSHFTDSYLFGDFGAAVCLAKVCTLHHTTPLSFCDWP